MCYPRMALTALFLLLALGPSQAQTVVTSLDGISGLVKLGEPWSSAKARLGKPAKTYKGAFATTYHYPNHQLWIEVDSKSRVESFITNSAQYVTDTGLKVGDPMDKAAQPPSSATGLSSRSGHEGLPDLQGRLDGSRKIAYLSSESSARTIEYIQWEAGDLQDRKALALSFPPVKNARRSAQPTVVTTNGIPFVVSLGELVADVKKRLGKPDVELKELGDTYYLYSKHAILLKAEKGKPVVATITTNDPRYVTETGLAVGDPFVRLNKQQGGFSGSMGEPGMPPTGGIKQNGIWYLTTSSDEKTAKVEYLRWQSF